METFTGPIKYPSRGASPVLVCDSRLCSVSVTSVRFENRTLTLEPARCPRPGVWRARATVEGVCVPLAADVMQTSTCREKSSESLSYFIPSATHSSSLRSWLLLFPQI